MKFMPSLLFSVDVPYFDFFNIVGMEEIYLRKIGLGIFLIHGSTGLCLGHNVVLEIQTTIDSTHEKPSKKPMWKGCIVEYIVVSLCYFSVAFIDYKVFGNSVEDNILITGFSHQIPLFIDMVDSRQSLLVHKGVIGCNKRLVQAIATIKKLKTSKQWLLDGYLYSLSLQNKSPYNIHRVLIKAIKGSVQLRDRKKKKNFVLPVFIKSIMENLFPGCSLGYERHEISTLTYPRVVTSPEYPGEKLYAQILELTTHQALQMFEGILLKLNGLDVRVREYKIGSHFYSEVFHELMLETEARKAIMREITVEETAEEDERMTRGRTD
ncbi:hypothetical protein GIB67_039927 [Kingdonia uniflora]|uniref:Amino acid transporter transmembrane domain-containing protein n=1 Tax=Kingdonia uniflora TaxID=39325 RepID=A0A7J7P3E7_9MAGN|nr:hypothetical protein GIB67_039927 [Kingdonia uniflora]